ncbi:MAG: hypothetical protein JWQ02_601 [Capsulimonas sp.]|nr:hypothetical protein [Capsulimonas sp.]
MTTDKRFRYSLAASLAFNAACIAVVGGVAAHRAVSHPHPPKAGDILHPKPLQMAAAPDANSNTGAQEKGLPGTAGDGDGASGSRGGGSAGHGHGKGASEAREGDGRGVDDGGAEAAAAMVKQLKQLAVRGGLTATQQAQLAEAEARLQAHEARLKSPATQFPAGQRPSSRDAKTASSQDAQPSASGKTPMQVANAKLSPNELQTVRPGQTPAEGPEGRSERIGDQTKPAGADGAPKEAQGASGEKSKPSSKMSVITQPSSPSKNGRGAAGGSSMAPKMLKYGKMKLNLGTIHGTRPNGPVTGGGLADQRNVEITAHMVVDDLKNQPKTFKPNKLVKRFPANCKGDPGNTSKCLPTGGNTSLGGGTLHGKNDHITGMKYCVPGAGGLPSAGGGGASGGGKQAQGQKTASGQKTRSGQKQGGGQKQGSGQKVASGQKTGQGQRQGGGGNSPKGGTTAYGATRGSSTVVSQAYQGGGASNAEAHRGWANGHENPNEPVKTNLNPQHLPSSHGDAHDMIPGAKAPSADRKWVYDPSEHTESAPHGERPSPLAQFRVSANSIGSMSKFGTIDWAPPAKTVRKKQPFGGDGSGLLGVYYRGNAFNQFVFKKPDRNIDFEWSGRTPDARLPANREYSVRWMGKLVPKVTDTYTIMTSSDDGVRLYIDGKLVISNWTTHGPDEDTVTMHLEAGHEYQIKLEYYENGYGIAEMRLYWEAPSVPREYIPESCLRYPKARELQ